MPKTPQKKEPRTDGQRAPTREERARQVPAETLTIYMNQEGAIKYVCEDSPPEGLDSPCAVCVRRGRLTSDYGKRAARFVRAAQLVIAYAVEHPAQIPWDEAFAIGQELTMYANDYVDRSR